MKRKRKNGRKEGRKEGKKEGSREGGRMQDVKPHFKGTQQPDSKQL